MHLAFIPHPMRSRVPLAALWSAAVIVSALAAAPRAAADELISPELAARFGWVENWRRQLDIGYGVDGIVDVHLDLMEDHRRTYVEVVQVGSVPAAAEASSAQPTDSAAAAKVLVRIPTDLTTASGDEIGLAEAQRLGRNEQRRFKRRGVETELREVEVPVVRLYTLSDRGRLQASDAETGQVLWTESIGNPRAMYTGIASDDDFVVVASGSNAYVFNANDGRFIRTRELAHSPLFAGLVGGGYAIFPLIDGSLQGVPLVDGDQDDFRTQASGASTTPLVRSPSGNKVAWATESGFVYVLDVQGMPNLDFRLDVVGHVSGRLATADGERFFASTSAGQVYAIEATREGRVLWKTPLGEPVYSDTVLIDDTVYVATAFGNLQALDAQTGTSRWERPATGVTQVVDVAGDYVIATSRSGGLIVLEAQTGNLIMRLHNAEVTRTLTNPISDRLYLISSRGEMQCLRPEATPLPEIHHAAGLTKPASDEPAPAANSPDEVDTPEATQPAPETEEADPFGTGDDPFGTGSGDAFGTSGEDPFATGADSF